MTSMPTPRTLLALSSLLLALCFAAAGFAALLAGFQPDAASDVRGPRAETPDIERVVPDPVPPGA